ncbi:MAG: NAD-binding protein [Anaerolineaceae bacterium]|nr:NAD-binding protein [Anaerolineaceae bacterium]
MDSFRETYRQMIIALVVFVIVLAVGILGMMWLEGVSFLDAIWITVTTLTTVGYGDKVAITPGGRIFTLILLAAGLSVTAYGIQASATFILSPAIRDMRQRRRTLKAVERLSNHYIICGAGELVDKTVSFIAQAAHNRKAYQREQIYLPLDRFLDGIFGDDAHGHFPRIRGFIRRVFLFFVRQFYRGETLLDAVVIVTPNARFADHLRNSGLLVVDGDPSRDEILHRAGLDRAQAMMVMLDKDTETLLAVLTARNANPNLYITAVTLDEALAPQMIRVGANSAIAPFDVAGQFLNNATLRPAVNDFFTSILFSSTADVQTTQLILLSGSTWVGKQISRLELRERFRAAVIGLGSDDGSFLYTPDENYILKDNDTLIVVAPGRAIGAMQRECLNNTTRQTRFTNWQRLPMLSRPSHQAAQVYTLEEAEKAVQVMAQRYIICGNGRVVRNAINKLDPERPFVIISNDPEETEELLSRGFRVIHGNPASETTLQRAGIDRALAIMISMEDEADSVLTVLNCRTLSKRLLITSTAYMDDAIAKLQRAGADRVMSPFQVAGQFVLLATTRPAVNDFLQYVLFNYHVGIETTELYMQNDSPWIGTTVEELHLTDQYRAGVIGVRQANGHFIYAPPKNHVIGEHEVLIVVTPMEHSDEIRIAASGSATKRPTTLRRSFRQ